VPPKDGIKKTTEEKLQEVIQALDALDLEEESTDSKPSMF
jgi:hypothetical protein